VVGTAGSSWSAECRVRASSPTRLRSEPFGSARDRAGADL